MRRESSAESETLVPVPYAALTWPMATGQTSPTRANQRSTISLRRGLTVASRAAPSRHATAPVAGPFNSSDELTARRERTSTTTFPARRSCNVRPVRMRTITSAPAPNTAATIAPIPTTAPKRRQMPLTYCRMPMCAACQGTFLSTLRSTVLAAPTRRPVRSWTLNPVARFPDPGEAVVDSPDDDRGHDRDDSVPDRRDALPARHCVGPRTDREQRRGRRSQRRQRPG